jgi:hypothetical protein
MLARTRQFLKNLVGAAWHCVSEEPATLVPAILLAICAGLLWLACDMVLEGDTTAVATRLASLSINPNNWV